MRRLYVALQVMIILLCYVVPYTLLAGARDLSLYLFWVILALLSIVLAVFRLSHTRGGSE